MDKTYRDCAMPYLTPTPTGGRTLMIRLTVAWSGKANRIEAARKKKETRIERNGGGRREEECWIVYFDWPGRSRWLHSAAGSGE